MITVLIADDHAIVREGLKRILAETGDISVIGEASRGSEVLDLIGKDPVDVLVMDISMPGRSGLDILPQVIESRPDLPVLMLSIYSEDRYAIRCLRAGAAGYLVKESAPDELIEAIRTIADGRNYITASLGQKLASHIRSGTAGALHESLSDREFQVLGMIATGMTVKEIAAELSLSVKTISTYRTRLCIKMHFSSNQELIEYASQHGLTD